jgi:hypothetical protein
MNVILAHPRGSLLDLFFPRQFEKFSAGCNPDSCDLRMFPRMFSRLAFATLPTFLGYSTR